ncbi:DUF3046 domain-containing protein [Demequina muriae]|uniref:DUF3046 domain-containing protein n=1 Tax=Demequina muriae TaxID=3051664 RepID=A0ABT8GDP7_9MICO|nr:DUF3046 domain-containing protein [Demequina sp. EGI L300058]MDN4479553.1 DUF3046 domain-containing protein [Demequina sp. EGI L300058]
MRHSQFWVLLDDVFGVDYSRSLARDLALDDLQSRTSVEALEAGVPPRDVWHALCDQMDVPLDRRDGGARERMIPPRR